MDNMNDAPNESSLSDLNPALANKKKAGKACLSCRSRKVRCDVSCRGQPCTNCFLDSKNCLVVGRRSRLRGKTRKDRPRNTQTQSQIPAPSCDTANASFIPSSTGWVEDVLPSTVQTEKPPPSSAFEAPSESSADVAGLEERAERVIHTAMNGINGGPDGWDGWPDADEMQWKGTGSSSHPEPLPSPPSTTSMTNKYHVDTPTLINTGSGSQTRYGNKRSSSASADVSYAHYSFLTAGRLHAIPPEDVNYLESQGCLHIPTQPSLDDLVQHYFLQVHVVLPILNEGDFWEMYFQSSKPGGSREKMSLLVFQAMLYASCNFISLETIKALGFSNIRTAKATFYRRVKLLYDMETEDSQLCLAQAALLLTCWVPGSKAAFQLKPNSTWLNLAIQHARSINADRCTTSTPTTSTAGRTMSSQPQKLQNMLRRLWWSCIIRDRLGSLCTRRSINITRDRFGFDAVTPLGFVDLEDEVHRSSVYNAATKRSLAGLLTHYIQFCIVLTDVLTLVFPFENAQQSRITPKPEDEAKIEECKLLLERWHERTSIYFPVFGGMMSNHGLNEDKTPHKSVVLNTNNLSARIALYHYSILYRSMTLNNAAEPSRHKILEIIHENRQELQDAALSVTECLGELVRRHLVHWLPITAVACMATPLALHSITAKLASARGANTTTGRGGAGTLTSTAGGSAAANSSSGTNQKRMTVFTEAMKAFLPRYEGTEWVAETVRHVSSLAQSLAESAGSSVADWTDLLARHTSSYLLMTMTIDVCISQGRLPEERDFPAWLRGRTGAVQGVLDGGRAAAAAHPVVEDAVATPSVGALSPTTTRVVGQAAMMGGPGEGFNLGSTGAVCEMYDSFAFQQPPQQQQRPETDNMQRELFGGAAVQTFDSFLQESSVMEDWEDVFLGAMNGLNYPNVGSTTLEDMLA